MDNLAIKDKMPAPKLSVMGKFHCIVQTLLNSDINIAYNNEKVVH